MYAFKVFCLRYLPSVKKFMTNPVDWMTLNESRPEVQLYLRYRATSHSCRRRYCALFKHLGRSQGKQTSSDWFLMTLTCLSLACGQIMGSSVPAAVFRRKPGSHWYCHWLMEQLLTRGLSHNTLARGAPPPHTHTHSKPILGSQYDILGFFPLRYQFREKDFFFITRIYSVFCIFWVYPAVFKRF